MRRIYAGLLFCVPAFGGWFCREWVKEVFWERVLHVLSPENSLLLEYAPPAVFAGIVVYLFLSANEKRAKVEMLAIAVMIMGAVIFLSGILLYKGETGRLPFSEANENSDTDKKLETEPQKVELPTQKPPARYSSPNVTDRFGDLGLLSNAALRRLTDQFCVKLRAYEASNTSMFAGPDYSNAKTGEDRNRIFEQFSKQLITNHFQYQSRFFDAFGQDISALKDELSIRLRKEGSIVPEAERVSPMFTHSLAGPNPIFEGCNYFQDLARKLPD